MSRRPPANLYELRDFPTVTLIGHTFYRIHRAGKDPAHFSTGPGYRFSPRPVAPADYGTCYLAETAEGAFVETLGRLGTVPDSQVQERAVSPLIVPETAALIADLTHPSVLGRFGINADLSMGADYELPQLWSKALHDAGFDGIHYWTRHDPSVNERSLALFGPPGLVPGFFKSVAEPEPISEGLILSVRRRYGIHVIPAVELDL